MKNFNHISKKTIAFFLIGFLFAGLKANALNPVRVAENRVIYEVFVRNFSATNNSNGDFKGVEAKVNEIKNLGVDVVWLMPFYLEGAPNWGPYSSPYAIKDFTEVDPKYGTKEDLRSLINAIHAAGMEVWFDWVGNHTAMDHPWVTQHRDWYATSSSGQRPYNPTVGGITWGDVYQLDVDNHEMHLEMIKEMNYWVTEFGIDGYRCDHASGPSQEFWKEATEALTKNGARISWLAEDSSEPELVTNGWFDYNWTWEFWGKMHDVKQSNVKGSDHYIYIQVNDDTYSGTLNLYAWGDGEAFGVWPGVAASDPVRINGTNYRVIPIPDSSGSYNLIINNGVDKNQTNSPDYSTTFTDDIFIKVENNTISQVTPSSNFISIEDKTGWDNFYVYAWGTGETFGVWPGIKGDLVKIGNKTYYWFDLPSSGNYNLIFNNGGNKDNGGIQYDAIGVNGGKNYYLTANPNSCDDRAGGDNERRLDALRQEAVSLHTDSRFNGRSRVMYTSSHDVVQDQGVGNDVGYRVFANYQKPFTVLQFTVYGCPVIYNGQEVNCQDGKVTLASKAPITWTNDRDGSTKALYKDLITLKHSHPSLLTGYADALYTNLSTSNDARIMAYMRGEGKNALVVMLNLSDAEVKDFTVDNLRAGNFVEMKFDGNFGVSAPVSFDSSSKFTIPAYGYKVFYNTEASDVNEVFDNMCHFYIHDLTGWDNLYVYGWFDDGGELFGSRPGAKAIEKTTIGDYEWWDISFHSNNSYVQTRAITQNAPVNLIFTDGKDRQYNVSLNDGSDIILDRDYYFIATDAGSDGILTSLTEITHEDVTPVYYNLQGMRVDKPTKGVYIKVTGAKTEKIIK